MNLESVGMIFCLLMFSYFTLATIIEERSNA